MFGEGREGVLKMMEGLEMAWRWKKDGGGQVEG
jgi:hypothetical protein